MKVSFDFDDTLDRESVQKYATELLERGLEVWILTFRFDNETYAKTHGTDQYRGSLANRDLFEVADQLGIPHDQIHFTNMASKWEWLKDKDFVFHLDDDWVEVRLISERTQTRGVSYFGNPNWKHKCEKALIRANRK